jgi:hypothetical protein
MTIRLPEGAVEALMDGESIRITHPNFGDAGRNGFIDVEMASEDEDIFTAEWR